MILIPWPSERVEIIWPKVVGLLDKAISFNNGYNPDDVLEAIKATRMQLFVVADDDNNIRGAVVTEILSYPRCKTLFVLFLGGRDYREWPMGDLWEWARRMGCTEATAIGRVGLEVFVPEAKTRFKFFQLDIGGGHV